MATALPEKLSAVLRIAVADVERCRARPDEYVVDVDTWYAVDVGERATDRRCYVCAAGAVMAMTLEAPATAVWSRSPWRDYPPAVAARLVAVDHVRRGHVHEGLAEVAIADDAAEYERVLTARQRGYDSAYDPRPRYDELRRVYGCGLGADVGALGRPETRLDLPWMLRVADVLERYGL